MEEYAVESLSKFMAFLRWVAGLFLVLVGVGLSFAPNELWVVGVLILFSGIVLLPVFQNKISEKLKVNIKKRWFIVAGLGLFLSGVLSAAAWDKNLQEKDRIALKNGTASQEVKDRETRRVQRQKERLEEQRIESEKEAREKNRAIEQEAREQAYKDKQNEKENLARAAQSSLRDFLRDPSSAEIRNQNGPCGEVNSKNGFGGYTGFRRYVAAPDIAVIEGDNMDSSEFQVVWDNFCH